ncbi:MAG: Lon protease family protein [Methylophilaceae bacterium]|jgi:predicted ATP-dependent protease|nr:ATP-binding protein [Methylophilaceae bacterium]
MQMLTPSELTVTFDLAEFGFDDTSQIAGQHYGWIGQQRAEKAARFGLGVDRPDYHLFVLGEAGSGRSSLMFRLMQEVAVTRPSAPDLVYLYNFERPECPLALHLHTGQAAVLRSALENFSDSVAREIPRKLDEESVRLDSERLKKASRQPVERAYVDLVAFAAARRFALRREEGRLVFTLMDENGQSMQEDAVLALPSEQRVALETAEQELRTEIGKYLDAVRPVEQELERVITELRHQAILPVLNREIESLRNAMADKVQDAEKFARYLIGLADDVLRSLVLYTEAHEEAREQLEARLSRYRVNVLVDSAASAGAPALRDDDPVFRSLFGGIDFQAENGILATDFTRIRAGNIHRAHGGYLMLHLRDVLRDATVWEKLQRYLRNGCLQIEEPAAASGQLSAVTLEPEAMEIRTKLVLIGSREDYYGLQEADPELMRHFRVKVDFAEYFPANADTRRAIGAFISQRCRDLDLPHFSSAAVARLLLEMQRAIDDQRHIGTELGELEAWLIEATAFCRHRGDVLAVSEQDVADAFAARRERHDYPEQQLLETIAAGELMIRVHGAVAGQINGLAQVDLGDYRFGLPVRITARAYAGDEGVLNIDREVEMTCPSHDKGVLILQGWLSAAFARQAPLCLSASLVFEQEYHGVEGDSASCAELFALLSAISGIALPQGIGVTGALNQHGEVMPVGGINEKIEGWFRTCRKLGLDGTQGVIIPARNRSHLVLDREVLDAVERGDFRIHVIDHVLDGIALLTGLEAGALDETGSYPEDSVMGRAQHTLEEYRKACDESGHPREHEHGK